MYYECRWVSSVCIESCPRLGSLMEFTSSSDNLLSVYKVRVHARGLHESHPRPFTHPLHSSPPAAVHFVIHPLPVSYQFLFAPPRPSSSMLCSATAPFCSLELYWRHIQQLPSVVTSFIATRPKYDNAAALLQLSTTYLVAT